MSLEEIAFTVLIPLVVVGGSWLGTAFFTKAKQRRKRNRVERGVADYLRRVSG